MASPAPRRHTAATVWAAALILAAAAGLPGGDFEWPGAAAVDAQDLSSLDRAQRRRTVERLASRRDPETRARLAALLDDSDPQIRLTVGRILARAGAASAMEAAARWTASATPAERPLGLEVLREVPGPLSPAARRAVERSLRDGEPTVRLLAIDALAKQETAPSFVPIAEASEDDNRDVRLRAVRLLGESHEARAVLPLLARLGDADRQVRLAAVRALGAAGDRRAGPALRRQLADPVDEIRVAVVDAIGQLALADAVPALAALARRRPADEVARRAILALGNVGGPVALAVLVDQLDDPTLADETAGALRRLGESALPALLDQATNGSPAGSALAVTLLGQLAAGTGPRGADPKIVRALTGMVERRSGATLAALQALGAVQAPAAVAVLARAAADPSPELRGAAYAALLETADDRALVVVNGGLHDRDPRVRRLALRLGVELGSSTPVFLSGASARLSDADAGVRSEAALTLIRLQQRAPEALPALLAQLARTPDDALFADALEAVVDPRDDAALIAAAGRARGAGRAAVARALAAAHATEPLTDGAAVDLLIGLLADGGANAEAAADALGVARLPADRATAILRAFADAEPSVRPRLCAALAALAGGVGSGRLVRALDDEKEAGEVRAAAAWAAVGAAAATGRDGQSLRAALQRAAGADEPPLAINARAALAALAMREAATAGARGQRRDHWAAIRLTAPGGAPRPRQWVALTAADGTAIWIRTGVDARARIAGMPPGPYQVELMDQSLVARSGDAVTRAAGAAALRGP
jgi:HEAT repeat protein